MVPLTWVSLVPPIFVVICACISHRLNLSIFLGIVTAALIVMDGNCVTATTLITQRAWEYVTNKDTIYLYIFLITIPALVELFIKTGASTAFTHTITKKIRSKRGIEFSSIISSLALSIDDYLSILTVGNVIRPLADHAGIPRVKLAYLVHALSGPLVILIPISSWIAPITAYLQQSGITGALDPKSIIAADPFYVYLRTLPFIFYSLLTIIAVSLIVAKRISFGPMYEHEKNNKQITNIHKQITESVSRGTLADLFIPIGTLFASIISGIAYFGDSTLFGGTRSVMEAFQHNTHIFLILCLSGTLSLSVGLVRALFKRMIGIVDIPKLLLSGVVLMHNSLIMLFLISILSGLLRTDLATGHYLAHIVTQGIAISFLPLILFFVSVLISIATGTSWGTFGLMLPITIPMLTSVFNVSNQLLPDDIPLMYAVLGAIFSGALCGDHISPFSETTAMSAVGTQTTPIEHVKTQLPYALPVIAGCVVAYTLCGFLYKASLWVFFTLPLTGGIVTCILLLYYSNRRFNS